MKFKATFQKPRIDLRRFKDDLDDLMKDKIREAARAWLGAATVRVPAWSGASLGTFRKLASAASFSLNINPTAQGSARGLGIGAGVSRSSGKITDSPDKGTWTFEYSTTLAHLIYNEYNNANLSPDPGLFSQLKRPGPYYFQIEGEIAAEAVMRGARLPEITIKTTPRTV